MAKLNVFLKMYLTLLTTFNGKVPHELFTTLKKMMVDYCSKKKGTAKDFRNILHTWHDKEFLDKLPLPTVKGYSKNQMLYIILTGMKEEGYLYQPYISQKYYLEQEVKLVSKKAKKETSKEIPKGWN